MKKTLLFLGIGLFFLFPFLVHAKDDVRIVEAGVLEKSEHATEVEEISYQQLTLSFKLSFQEVNDYIRYKVVVQNDSNKDYEIRSDTDGFQNSDYFLYQFDFDGDSNVVKAHSSRTMYLMARYMQEIDSSLYEDGKFVERKQMKINLANDTVTNPYTKIPYAAIIIGVIATVIGLIISLNNKKYLKMMYGVFLFGLLIVPLIGYALEVLSLEVNSVIEVVNKPEFCYYDYLATPQYQYFEYTPGMTMSEYLENHDLEISYFQYGDGKLNIDELNAILSQVTNGEYTNLSSCVNNDEFEEYYFTLSDVEQGVIDNIMGLYIEHKTRIFANNPILDKSIGCYAIKHK